MDCIEISSNVILKQESHQHTETAATESRQPKLARFRDEVPGRLHVLSSVR